MGFLDDLGDVYSEAGKQIGNGVTGVRNFAVETIGMTADAVAKPAGDALGGLLKDLQLPLMIFGGLIIVVVLLKN